MWQYRGQRRPAFAQAPKAGQESVWDYPRPPALVRDQRRVRVCLGDRVVAESVHCYRVLETASAPTFYLPPTDVDQGLLRASATRSFCEWKGVANYWTVRAGERELVDAAWSYPEPEAAFEPIAGYFSFYPARLDCFVGDQRVRAQPGGFYGGWVTDEVVGPFKGEPGTLGW